MPGKVITHLVGLLARIAAVCGKGGWRAGSAVLSSTGRIFIVVGLPPHLWGLSKPGATSTSTFLLHFHLSVTAAVNIISENLGLGVYQWGPSLPSSKRNNELPGRYVTYRLTVPESSRVLMGADNLFIPGEIWLSSHIRYYVCLRFLWNVWYYTTAA